MRIVLAILFLVLTATAFSAERPNIILIMADDLGYGDVGCYGASADTLPTPNIDRLAAEGLRFTRGYCSASTCTPTRYSLMTGQYAFRQQGTGIGGINTAALVRPGRTTLPSLLKSAGYATAVVGKWHLGLGEKEQGPQWNGELKPGPLEIGFDYCFLLPNTNDRVPSVYVENHRVRNLDPADPLTVSNKNPDGQPTGKTHRHTLRMDWSHGHSSTIHNGISRIGFMSGGKAALWRDEDLADDFIRQSVAWIEAHQNERFFLFFSSHDCHVPRMPHERFQGKSTLGYRGDAIVQLDWCVGELIKTLKRHDLDEKTLVIFCSDNGPVLDDGYRDGAEEKVGTHQPAGMYRGGKYSVYEGGTRIPFITWWPGQIRPGVSDEMVCTIDLAASVAAMTGQSLPQDACPDSFDVWDALVGKRGASGRRQLIQQGNNMRRLGFIDRNWKLIRAGDTGKGNARRKKDQADSLALYNLEVDPGEQYNLVKVHPDKAKALSDQLNALIQAGRSRVTAVLP